MGVLRAGQPGRSGRSSVLSLGGLRADQVSRMNFRDTAWSSSSC